MNEIEFYKKKAYGRIDRYVLSPEIARAFELITGKKNLSDEAKKGFKMMGIKFIEVSAPI